MKGIRCADRADIFTLTELRMAFLQEEFGETEEEKISKIRRELPAYFERNLNQTIFCYLAEENGEAVACAFLLVTEKPMNPMFLSGKTGTVMNVYTKPPYRRRGYAKRLVQRLLLDAEENQLSVVELKATAAGVHLYESMGFTDDVSPYRLMKWRNQKTDL